MSERELDRTFDYFHQQLYQRLNAFSLNSRQLVSVVPLVIRAGRWLRQNKSFPTQFRSFQDFLFDGAYDALVEAPRGRHGHRRRIEFTGFDFSRTSSILRKSVQHYSLRRQYTTHGTIIDLVARVRPRHVAVHLFFRDVLDDLIENSLLWIRV